MQVVSWSSFAGPNWSTPAGPLQTLAAVTQADDRGAQLWTIVQEPPGGDWGAWANS